MSRDSSRSRGERDGDGDSRNRTRSSTRSQSTEWGSESSWGETGGPFGDSSRSGGPDTSGITTVAEAERYYGRDIEGPSEINALQRLEESYGGQVHEWIEEGVPIGAMGDIDAVQRFRRREDTPVPWDIERFNRESERRNTSPVQRRRREGSAGEVGVPESVREVVASPGQPLDDTIQRAVESRTGDSFGDVRIHTGPRAAQAAEAIDARAFTVGNHIAFGRGEYDPESPAGQHVLVHELAHVRQQTGGALSMLPQADALEVDPDERLEREAEETARRVMQGGELGVQRLGETDVHVQRLPELEKLQEHRNDPMTHIEALSSRIDNIDQRVSALEGEERSMMEKLGAEGPKAMFSEFIKSSASEALKQLAVGAGLATAGSVGLPVTVAAGVLAALAATGTTLAGSEATAELMDRVGGILSGGDEGSERGQQTLGSRFEG